MDKHGYSRREFLRTAGLAASVLAFVPGGFLHAQPAKKPNILIILVDDLGYGDLSSYGATDLQTPQMDALMEQGMRFDNFYANCPVCSPTRASTLTGRYPELVGVPGVIRTHPDNNWGYLDPEAILLPEMLHLAGYHTGIIGKWHLGLESPNVPNDRGFDHFHGFLGDMMDDYYTHRRHNINYMRWNRLEIDPKGHATDLFTKWSIDYIESRVNTSQPFFLYLAYNAPHNPVQPPAEWLDRVKQREPGISEKRAKLVALIEHMDDGIGKVMAALKESGQAENTLILFTSDNGGLLSAGASNGDLRGGKQMVYEGGIREPMCAVWPGHIPAGSRSSAIALTMDFFPTACQVAGVDIRHSIDGNSMLPVLLGKSNSMPERDLYWTRREGGNRYMGKTIWAVRRGDWKLLQNSPMEPFELYNLREDPKEEHNLADSNPGKFNELARALRVHMQRGGAVPWQRPEDK